MYLWGPLLLKMIRPTHCPVKRSRSHYIIVLSLRPIVPPFDISKKERTDQINIVTKLTICIRWRNLAPDAPWWTQKPATENMEDILRHRRQKINYNRRNNDLFGSNNWNNPKRNYKDTKSKNKLCKRESFTRNKHTGFKISLHGR